MPFKTPLLGAAFAFGWTPCVGPILATILTYVATMDTVNKGVMLLIVYSAGLGIPFLLTTTAMNGFLKLFSKIKTYMSLVQKNQRCNTGAFRNTDDNRKIDLNNGQTGLFKQIGLVVKDTNNLVERKTNHRIQTTRCRKELRTDKGDTEM